MITKKKSLLLSLLLIIAFMLCAALIALLPQSFRANAASLLINSDVITCFEHSNELYKQNISVSIDKSSAYSSSATTVMASYSEKANNNGGINWIEGHTLVKIYKDNNLLSTTELCKIDIDGGQDYVTNKKWKCPYACGNTGSSNTGSSGNVSITLSDEGRYYVKIESHFHFNNKDATTASTTSSVFFIDKTAPSLSSMKPTGSISTTNAYLNATDNYAVSSIYYKYNKNSFKDCSISDYDNIFNSSYIVLTNTTYNSDGYYSLLTVDRAGNVSDNYQICLDTTKPTLYCGTVGNGMKTKDKFTITANDATTGIAQLQYKNGGDWINAIGNSIDIEDNDGHYFFRAMDGAGWWSYEYSVIYDTTAPELKCSTITNNEKITNNGYIKSGSAFLIDALDSVSGLVTVSYEFTSIDNIKSTPEILFSGLSINFNEKFTINNSKAGTYEITATDAVGKSSIFTINVDGTAPTLSFENALLKNDVYLSTNRFIVRASGGGNNNFGNDGIYNILYSSSQSTYPTDATIPISSYTTFNDELFYLFKVTDSVGNSNTYKVLIDKTLPIIKSSNIGNGKYLKVGSSFTVDASDSSSGLTSFTYDYTKTDGTNTNDTIFSGAPTTKTQSHTISSASAGMYLFTATDNIGKNSTYTIYIDETVPTLSFDNTTFLSNGFYVSNGNFTVRSASGGNVIGNDKLADISYSFSDLSFPSSAKTSINSETQFSIEGFYFFAVTDSVGNENTYKVYIDKTVPVLHCIDISDGKYTKNGSSFTVTALDIGCGLTSFTYDYTETDGSKTTYTIFSGAPTTKKQSYTIPNASIGQYIFSATDAIGKKRTYTIFVDGTAPTLRITSSKDIVTLSDGTLATNGNITLAFSDGGSVSGNDRVANIYYNFSTSSFPQSPDTKLPDMSFSANGYYFFSITDSVGNKNEYKIMLWTKPADIIINNNLYSNGSNVFFNTLSNDVDVKYQTTNSFLSYTKSLFKNGSVFSGSICSEEGNYIYSVSDNLGNVSSVTFTISNAYPSSSNKTLINNYFITSINEITYIFENYDNALSIANTREKSKVEYTGLYKNISSLGYTIYSSDYYALISAGINDYSNYNCVYYRGFVYFNTFTSNFETIVASNAKSSVTAINYMTASNKDKSYPAYSGENAYKTYKNNFIYYSKVNVTLTQQNNCLLEINGIQYSSYTISEEGLYAIKETSFSGLSNTYYILIDKTAPTLKNDGSLLLPNTDYYLSGTLTFNIFDVETNYANGITYSYKFNSEPEKYGVSADLTLTGSGHYVITIKDSAGNSNVYSIYLLPDDKLEDYIKISYSEISGIVYYLNIDIDCGQYNSLVGINISLNSKGLTADRNGVNINVSNLSYSFGANGIYTLNITDFYGRVSSIDIEFTAGKVIGYLRTRSGDLLQDGNSTNDNYVYYTWADNLSASATIIGGNYLIETEYLKDTRISSEGTYRIILKSTDDATNFIEINFSIDRTPSDGKIFNEDNVLLSSKTYTNKAVYFTWDEDNYTANYSWNGNTYAYTKNKLLTADGEYTFYLYDAAGNYSATTIFLSKTGDSISACYGSSFDPKYLSNNDFTNKNFWFTWGKSTSTATLNGMNYISGTKISVEGTYLLAVTDRYGNVTTMTISVDKTPPSAILYDKAGNVVPNNTVSALPICLDFTSDDIVSAKYNSFYAYENGTYINSDGSHTIVIYDKAGNSTTYTFTLKLSATSLSLFDNKNTELLDGQVTSASIYAYWADNNCTAYYTLNNGARISYQRSSVLKSEGNYIFYLYDAANTCTTKSITIDKTAPKGEFVFTDSNTPVNSTLVNVPIIFRCNELCTSIYFINGIEQGAYSENVIFDKEGTYTVTLIDAALNSISYTITIDSTPPTGELKTNSGSLLESGAYTTTNFYFTWSESNCLAYYTFNGGTQSVYTRNTILKNDGTYVFYLYDAAENCYISSILLDKSKPEGIIFTENGNPLVSGESTNLNIYFEWEESNCYTYYYTVSGKKIYYTNGDILTNEDTYTFYLYDLSNNYSMYSITIDKTPPTGAFYLTNGNELTNGSFSKTNFNFNWLENDCQAFYTLNDGTSIAYDKGTYLSAEGNYIFCLYDKVGNFNTFSLVLDKTAPIGELFNENNIKLTSNTITNQNIYFMWDDISCIAYYQFENNVIFYQNGELLKDEGTYVFYLYDLSENVTIYTITIDKIPPTGNIMASTGTQIQNDGYTVNAFYFTWTESDCYAYYVFNNDNRVVYSKNFTFKNEGKYTFYLYDTAGNLSISSVTYDKTAPIGEIKDSKGNSITSGTIISDSISFTWSESACHASYLTFSGEMIEYTKDYIFKDEGIYTFYLYDAAGNYSVKSVTIDLTPANGKFFTNTEKEIENNSLVNCVNFYFTWSESNCTVFYTLNGGTRIAYTKGTMLKAEGNYVFFLIDIANNCSTYSVALDKTAPIGAFYDTNLKQISSYIVNYSVFFSSDETCNALYWFNDEEIGIYQSSIIFSAVGTYKIILTDAAGNTTTYTITIDNVAPLGKLVAANGQDISEKDYINEPFTFTWEEADCSAFYTFNNGERKTYTKGTSLKADGEYNFYLYDKADNFSSFKIILNKTKPTGTLFTIDENGETEINNGDVVNKNIKFTWEDLNFIATISIDGNTATVYSFGTILEKEGSYVIILTDLADNNTIYSFIITKVPPIVSAFTESTKVVDDGATIIESFYFSWDKLNCVASINDKSYTPGTLIVKNGTYTIVIMDAAGNSTEFTVILYKHTPDVTLVTVDKNKQVSNNGSITSGVLVEWKGEYTVTVNGNVCTSGTVLDSLGSYTLNAKDIYGNETTIIFSIVEDTSFSFLKGSPVVTVILIVLLSAALLGGTLIPIMINVIGGGKFKSKHKKIK